MDKSFCSRRSADLFPLANPSPSPPSAEPREDVVFLAVLLPVFGSESGHLPVAVFESVSLPDVVPESVPLPV